MLKTFVIDKLNIELVQGDITELKVDAIVNAANPYLRHMGGVARAIVKKGGDEIQRESDEYVRRHGPVPVGGIAVTGAGRLKAKYVIHAVGPKYGDPAGDVKLASAIRNALNKADELGLSSIALPAISTGVYGYPYERCAEIMVEVIKKEVRNMRNLKRIVVCLYDNEAYNKFIKVFRGKIIQ
ncbi:MAG: ADP-ribose-binding protein [Thermoprotei archaeon]|nr:MAG: ADP-ribose-binding protein [Thermoprotei archaeon]